MTDAENAANEPVKATHQDAYVSRYNRPLYDELQAHKDNLRQQEERLAYLKLMRDEKEADLLALQNRLTSEGVEKIDTVTKVQALRGEIASIDGEMTSVTGEISTIRNDIDGLQERLARVMPGQGANLSLIRELEKGETWDIVKRNTYGCVNHIVSKMPIPAVIANDAYLWNDNVLRYAEYGISSGDVPLPGSVIAFEREHSWADSQYGHLMYVEKVVNGEVWITDNYHPNTAVRLTDITTEISGENVTYLYFPWHTRVN
jgi:hypothetical protein